MSDVVIRAEGIGKKYVIGHESAGLRDSTLRDAIVRVGRGLARALKETAAGRPLVAGDTTEEFWALKDVSFDVARGEVLGIIGRNGAGKSTLLKILSRITEPTEGRVEIRGRVASLLEVGTGFHPELTGRENIFLNGAILGMSHREIRRKFDEIVDFAGVERFIDTPVKRYSSGMHVRLAFAVAAHLEPEILIVDEVLAVGDAEFQRKCLGKMEEVAGTERTVLFVSHNMGALRRLCSATLLLSLGRLAYEGKPDDAIARYVGAADASNSVTFEFSSRRPGSGDRVRIEQATIAKAGSYPSLRLYDDIDLSFRVVAESPPDMVAASVWVLFRNMAGDDVMIIMQKDTLKNLPANHIVDVRLVTQNILAPGRYSIACGILGHGRDIWDWVDEAGYLTVEHATNVSGTYDSRLGMTSVKGEWQVSQCTNT